MSAKNRVFAPEFRIGVVQRLKEGANVSALSQELAIKRSVLYRWRDAFVKEGEAGLKRAAGRPAGQPGQPRETSPTASPLENAHQRIAELERKIGQQEVEADFLKRAFKQVAELRSKKQPSGATASTRRSGV